QRGVLEVGEAGSVLGLGQEQVPQPLCPGLGLELLDEGQHLPWTQRLRLLDVALLVGIDVLLHEGGQAPLQVLHFGRGIERHGASSVKSWIAGQRAPRRSRAQRQASPAMGRALAPVSRALALAAVPSSTRFAMPWRIADRRNRL